MQHYRNLPYHLVSFYIWVLQVHNQSDLYLFTKTLDDAVLHSLQHSIDTTYWSDSRSSRSVCLLNLQLFLHKTNTQTYKSVFLLTNCPDSTPSLRTCVQRILPKVLRESWELRELKAAWLELLEYEGMAVSSGLSSSGLGERKKFKK